MDSRISLNIVYNGNYKRKILQRKRSVVKKKKETATSADIEAILDQMGIAKGAAREKAKSYCQAKLDSAEGNCLPTDDLSVMARAYFDGYSESMRGG